MLAILYDCVPFSFILVKAVAPINAAAAKRKKLKEDREFEENLKQWLMAGVVLVLALGLFVGLFTVIVK
jgi:hypothetical protein